MKLSYQKLSLMALFVAGLTISSNSYGHNIDPDKEFPDVKGPLIGQSPPGLVAEPFAKGIISKEGWDAEAVFAPGMSEFYFTRKDAKYPRRTVIGYRQINNVWKKFTEFPRIGEIGFSHDGDRMYMAEGYKDRIGEQWSERKSLGLMFDRKDWGIMRLSASEKGTFVFDDYKSGDIIRMSTLKNGHRQAPVKMDSEVNVGEWTAHPFIAPDERYLIWDSEREGGFGGTDLYIRFKQKDGTWGKAINMGAAVNSSSADYFASVTPDGKYLLFNRQINDNDNTDVYWVSAKIIDALKAKY